MQVLEDVLTQGPGRTPPDEQTLSALGDAIRTKIGWSDRAEISEWQFLHDFYAALRARHERRLMLGRALVQGDREYLVVRRPRRQEELRVRVFDFQPERMEELRDDLERLFEGEGLSDGAGSEEGEQAAAEDAQAEEPRDVAGDADGDSAAEGTVTDSAVTDSAVTEGVDSPATSAS